MLATGWSYVSIKHHNKRTIFRKEPKKVSTAA